MKKEHAFLYGGFFAFLPRVRGFLLETVFPERAVCRTCGRITGGGILCGGCRSRLLSDGMTMAWDREELEPEKCLADELADLLLPVPSYISFPPETVVTWVPMPESRRRERCIDHGKALAEAAAARLGLPCRPLLLRLETRDRPQATLGQKARKANLAQAFVPAEKCSFPVLLVDDVLTTGTTARRCAEALRAGGAAKVTLLAFTRALGHLSAGPGSI